MSRPTVMTSLLERLHRWTLAEAPDRAVLRFRRVFAGIWLAYDLCDIVLRGTVLQLDPFELGRPAELTVIQMGLVVVELGMLLGRRSATLFTLLALILRMLETTLFPVNDFYYFSVVCALLVVPGNPRWRWQALLWQTAWIYFATALLKVNDEWLSGGHLFARYGYLWHAQGWPHLQALEPCMASLSCLSVLAWGAVAAELTLAGVLLVSTPRLRPLAVLLVVGIHLHAALSLNVWFFGASMIAQVALLHPRRPSPSATLT